MIKNSCLILFVFVFGFASAIGQKPIEIGGTVVDKEDRPVAAAYVSLVYDPADDASGGPILVWRTLEDGYFGFETIWKPRRRIILIVESIPADRGFSPISGEVLFRNKLYPGIVIGSYRREVSLGKIRNYLKYESVRLDTTNCGQSFVDNIKRASYFLRIKDQRNRVLAYSSIPATSIANNQSVHLFLPPGEWSIEIVEEATESVILPSQRIRVGVSETRDLKLSPESCNQSINL